MSEELTAAQQHELLGVARAAVRRRIVKSGLPEPSARDPKLKAKRGVFVTLKVDGRLRGCIGHPLPVEPLDQAVVEVAAAAAAEDFRFEPLRPDELDRLRNEISVLSLPRRIKDLRSIEVGRHGLLIAKGYHRGTLLPQVAVERGWDRETFLRQTCYKAGLPPDAWKEGAEIYTYEADVFGEKDLFPQGP